PDLHGTPRSPWNQALANVFAQNFAASDLYEGEDLEFIKRLFFIHLNTLKRSYTRQNLETPEEKAAEQDRYQQSKRDSRRRNLFKRRKQACLNHPDLEKYAQVLANAGLFLMSGDESCGDGCSILKMSWRSQEVRLFLRDLDVVHLSSRYFNGKPQPGQWPNYRVEGARKDHLTRAPVGLPQNFYDPQWMREIGEDGQRILKMKPAMPLVVTKSVRE
ncbi:hypothetical protein BJ322DRAFT_1011680, partial [Thelephora terrestris]